MRLTVGPLPPSVYWRRRALVLGAALLVLFLVAQACMAATAAPGGDAAGDPSPSAAVETPAATPPLTAPPAPPVTDRDNGGDDRDRSTSERLTGDECRDEDMLITAEADRTTFAAGDPVQFTIRIRNDSDRTCVRDIGGELRELYLIQGTGANKVWSTQHCGGPSGRDEAQLPPGFETTYFIVWSGRTSTTCDGEDRPAGPMVTPGKYQLFARLGTAYSEPLGITIG
jgi:hypothetical protein